MDMRKLYQRWVRLGTPPTGLTARAVIATATPRGTYPLPSRVIPLVKNAPVLY